MGRPRVQSRFTISVELNTNSRQERIIDRRLIVVGKLYNAILDRLLGRVEHSQASPGYRAACKKEPDTPEGTARFKELEFEFGLREQLEET
jgi:hypothetical protein